MINSTILCECIHEAVRDLDEIIGQTLVPDEDDVEGTLGKFMSKRVINELMNNDHPNVLAELSAIRDTLAQQEVNVRALQWYLAGASSAASFQKTVRDGQLAK